MKWRDPLSRSINVEKNVTETPNLVRIFTFVYVTDTPILDR